MNDIKYQYKCTHCDNVIISDTKYGSMLCEKCQKIFITQFNEPVNIPQPAWVIPYWQPTLPYPNYPYPFYPYWTPYPNSTISVTGTIFPLTGTTIP